VILSGYINFTLLSEKVTVHKGRNNTTQLLFEDMKYASLFADTRELLEYLENMTEQVRLIDMEQNHINQVSITHLSSS